MTDKKIYCGVDIGASATKIVLINHDAEILGHRVERTGARGPTVAEECRNAILEELGLGFDSIGMTVSTGYAREDIPFADTSRTEITCHSRGCLHAFSGPITIVDIGGQDNKIIYLDDQGRRTNFKLNRKCAAGTGAFLEEMANLMAVPISDLNGLAEQAESPIKLGSYCTVFAKTEILTNFRKGDRLPDIVAGAFHSVVRRIIEMDILEGKIVLTGGVVAHNPYIVKVFEEMLGRPVNVPPQPQLTGAIGAALIGIELAKE
ncbi:MAG: acyl-CoA dehydratase activase [bacterium]|nr:acyl-CoA dehydratase activase [bacterium]